MAFYPDYFGAQEEAWRARKKSVIIFHGTLFPVAMKISVIITDYLKADRVVRNVAGIRRQSTKKEVEIIIVDNSCDSGNAAKLKGLADVRLIVPERNLGYPIANNIAAREARGDLLFFVNPDIDWPEYDVLDQIIAYLQQNPQTGVVGPRIVSERSGEPEYSARNRPDPLQQVCRRTALRRIPWVKSWLRVGERQPDSIAEVDWLQSSFMAIPKQHFEEIGGFPERFFLFYSDTELCRKSRESGKKVIYFPEVFVHSDGIRCSEGGMLDIFRKKTLRIHLADSMRYYLGR